MECMYVCECMECMEYGVLFMGNNSQPWDIAVRLSELQIQRVFPWQPKCRMCTIDIIYLIYYSDSCM